jgi:hypothetical protein
VIVDGRRERLRRRPAGDAREALVMSLPGADITVIAGAALERRVEQAAAAARAVSGIRGR